MTIVNIEDLRRLARRRLPRALFEFVDGGSWDELTLRANRADFERLRLRQKVLVDVSRRSLATRVLGAELALPLVLAPIGNAGMLARAGEAQAARAAEKAGAGFALSTMSIQSIEQVRAATSRPFWFQLYVMKDRGLTRAIIERAQAAGCPVLMFTADLPVLGQRERDLRNGFTVPPRITLSNAFDTLRRPGWLLDVLLGPRITYGNLVATGGETGLMSLAAHVQRNNDDTLNWKDLEWARSLWRGKLVVKGVLTAEDARLCAGHGADGVVVSNHGGRQLDGAPSTITALPAIADAVGDRLEVLFDGGIRRGQDVLKALALGARACLIGRAFLYGLGAMGEAGVTLALDILRREMDATLALLGCTGVAQLGRDCVLDAPAPKNS